MINKKVWFYDIEQFPNLHTCTFKDRDSNEVVEFVIHDDHNQAEEYLNFLLKRVSGLIGFNNLDYDYPMIHWILTNLRYHLNEPPIKINSLLYQKSQEIIGQRWSSIPYWEELIPQIDLFRIHHFDNEYKRTSLKEIQFILGWKDVMDFDKSFDDFISYDEIKDVLLYNRNDVLSTEALYYETITEIKFRKDAKKLFGFGNEVLNWNDGKIGGEVLLRTIAFEKGVDLKELKKMRTSRDIISLKDIVIPYISFKTSEFQSVLKTIKSTVVTDTGQFKKKIKFKGVKFEFGSGGLHACNKSGVYEATEEYDLLDIDVASFYPRIGIVNKFSPEHLGDAFCTIYEDRYNYRMSIKHNKNKKNEAGAWKLGLNKPFGDSKSPYSPFYDPMYTLKITINGQLLLAMLTERILLLGNVELVQVNTDGLSIKFPKDMREQIMDLCSKWEKRTQLELEYVDYKKMIVRDVNNYIAVIAKDENELSPSFPDKHYYENWYTRHKTKGAFQVVPEANGKIAWNKDWSMRIVPKALYKYFIYGIPIKKTILECDNILDFCKRFRCKSDWKAIFIDNNAKEHQLTKTTRYYMSSNGGVLLKRNYNDRRENRVEAKGRVTIYNTLDNRNITEYNIDYTYYIKECNKIVNVIENYGQQTLFK